MADGIKISELPEIETLRDGCCFPVISEVDGTMQNVKIKKINLEKNLVNNNYSEEETVIGKWVDGRSIYRIAIPYSKGTRTVIQQRAIRTFTRPDNIDLTYNSSTNSFLSNALWVYDEPTGDLSKQYVIFIYIKKEE